MTQLWKGPEPRTDELSPLCVQQPVSHLRGCAEHSPRGLAPSLWGENGCRVSGAWPLGLGPSCLASGDPVVDLRSVQGPRKGREEPVAGLIGWQTLPKRQASQLVGDEGFGALKAGGLSPLVCCAWMSNTAQRSDGEHRSDGASAPPTSSRLTSLRGPFFELCKTRAFLHETVKCKWKKTRPTNDSAPQAALCPRAGLTSKSHGSVKCPECSGPKASCICAQDSPFLLCRALLGTPRRYQHRRFVHGWVTNAFGALLKAWTANLHLVNTRCSPFGAQS